MKTREHELKVAFRRNRQKREWTAYAQRLARILQCEPNALRLLDASESIQFEERLFKKTREGISNGSIGRSLEVSANKLELIIANALSVMKQGPVIVAPVNAMDFAFFFPVVPQPKQLSELVSMDGDTVFVVSRDLAYGVGVDVYESEKTSAKCFEVDVWK